MDNSTLTVLIAFIVMLFVIGGALAGVVKFSWGLYIKIMTSISDSAERVIERMDKENKLVNEIDKRVTVIETKLGGKND